MRLQFLEERFKHQFYLLKPNGHFACTRCKKKYAASGRRGWSVSGKYLVFETKATKAIDGSNAYRIFFTCDMYGHLCFVGYTKPVDFSMGYEQQEIDTRTFAEEEADEEAELMEYLKFERKNKPWLR